MLALLNIVIILVGVKNDLMRLEGWLGLTVHSALAEDLNFILCTNGGWLTTV